jgi:hypothetical protein
MKITFPDILGQSLDFVALMQKDLRDGKSIIPEGEEEKAPPEGGVGGRVDTQYFGLGLSGGLGTNWYFDLFSYLGTGRILSYVASSESATDYVYRYQTVVSVLAGFGLRAYFEQALFSRLSVRGLFSSGDSDQSSYLEGNTSGFATTFVPISLSDVGLIFTPRLGNIFLIELSYSLKPFANARGRILKNLQFQLDGLDGTSFFRSSTGPISEAVIDPGSNSLYLGSELAGRIDFRPTSDLGIGLSGGLFFPNDQIYLGSAAAEWLGKLELSLSM